MSEGPFGRQPKPVTVTIIGDAVDVMYWSRAFMDRAESAGDLTQRIDAHNADGGYFSFKIYPRAVND